MRVTELEVCEPNSRNPDTSAGRKFGEAAIGEMNMESRTYDVGRSKITLLFGDITSSQAEVLVSSDDYLLSMG